MWKTTFTGKGKSFKTSSFDNSLRIIYPIPARLSMELHVLDYEQIGGQNDLAAATEPRGVQSRDTSMDKGQVLYDVSDKPEKASSRWLVPFALCMLCFGVVFRYLSA